MPLERAEFDANYRMVRQMVLRGEFRVATAKLWIRDEGEKTIQKILAMKRAQAKKQYAQRIDLELEAIKEYTKEIKKANPVDDEDDNDE